MRSNENLGVARIVAAEIHLGDAIAAQLIKLGLEDTVSVYKPWHRSGGETYSTVFSTDGASNLLIAKSCVKFFPKETMTEWLERRNLVAANGVCVPEVFARDDATVVEEYLPASFREAYKVSDEATGQVLRHNFIDTFKRVVGAGFAPGRDSFYDLRVRGADVVMIDFGEDLGTHKEITECSIAIAMQAEQRFRELIH